MFLSGRGGGGGGAINHHEPPIEDNKKKRGERIHELSDEHAISCFLRVGRRYVLGLVRLTSDLF